MPKLEEDFEKVIAGEVLKQEGGIDKDEYDEKGSINNKVEHFLSSSLTDDSIDKLREVYPDLYRQVKDIKKYLIKLSEIINQDKSEPALNCHFNERLGNFLGSSGFILRIVNGKKMDDDSFKRVLDNAEDFRNYFATCLADKDYLAKELEAIEGAIIQ